MNLDDSKGFALQVNVCSFGSLSNPSWLPAPSLAVEISNALSTLDIFYYLTFAGRETVTLQCQ